MDVAQWKLQTEEEEVAKNIKKMRMFYGHLCMWDEKMQEIARSDRDVNTMTEEERQNYKGNIIDDPLPRPEINRKKDKDFVYF